MASGEAKQALMLSVSGMRGQLGGAMTPSVAAKFAACYGQWVRRRLIRESGGPGEDSSAVSPTVTLGRDGRASGPCLFHAAASGLMSVGCQVVDLGVLTTPGHGVMIRHLEADGGIEVTASHNPLPWNGLKPLDHEGKAPPPDEIQPLIDAFHADAIDYEEDPQPVPIRENYSADSVHVNRILPRVDARGISRRRPRVVIDSVHGSGGGSARALAEALGVELVHLHAEPTGRFPHPPEPAREHLESLCQAVVEHQADIGFAQDPDADRLAVVDETGRYIGEEYTLVLGCLNLLNRLRQTKGEKLVANLSTSRMINDVAEPRGVEVIRSPVGEANVVHAMMEHNALCGGEGNGGIIWPDIGLIRDSLLGIALVLELLAHDPDQRPLSRIVDEDIPRYTMVRDKLPLADGMSRTLIEKMQAAFGGQPMDTRDGLRVDWPDRWIHVRPSNTEPILRIIAEARTPQEAQSLVEQVREML